MSVYASISGSACQVLAISVGNMLAFRVLEALCKSEINDEDAVFGLFSAPNKEIIRLDVSVNNSFIMNFLNSLQL